MAVRKFLFFNTTDGFSEEQAATDELSIGKITLSGVGGVAIDAGNQLISNVTDPVAAQDAATKAYVDAYVNGLDWKNSVRVLADTNITLSGVQTIDGVLLVAGDRVLVAGQTTGSANGIYVVAAGAWSRATDADVSAEVTPNLAVFVEEGTANADTGWTLITDGPITLGTTALVFSQFTGTGSIIAGAGILKTSNTLDVELDTAAGAQNAGSGGGSSGLEFDTSGAAGKLRAAVHATAGLERTASGLGVKLNGTTLQSAAGGVSVKGLPSLFEINAVATSANVTAANLGTLTAGPASDASALHSHQDDVQFWVANGGIAAGSGVYINGSAQVSQGANTSVAASRIIGVADAAILTTATGAIKLSGAVAGVLSGATPGVPYYLGATGLPVLYSTLGGSDRVVRLGFAKTATALEVRVLDLGKKA